MTGRSPCSASSPTLSTRVELDSVSDPDLTLRPRMDNKALGRRAWCASRWQIGARRARAYEELTGRLREEPCTSARKSNDTLCQNCVTYPL